VNRGYVTLREEHKLR